MVGRQAREHGLEIIQGHANPKPLGRELQLPHCALMRVDPALHHRGGRADLALATPRGLLLVGMGSDSGLAPNGELTAAELIAMARAARKAVENQSDLP